MTKLEELERLKDVLKAVAASAYDASVAAYDATEYADDAYEAALRAYQDELEREAEQ